MNSSSAIWNLVSQPSVNRRQFLGRSASNAAGLAAGLVGLAAGAEGPGPTEVVRVGVVGVRLYVEEQNLRAHEVYRCLGLREGGYFVMERFFRRDPESED